jgi:hypothetical protein
MQSTFTNELNNEITVTTQLTDFEGGYQEMEISIQGPASSSSWVVTMAEAREVHRQLTELLA